MGCDLKSCSRKYGWSKIGKVCENAAKNFQGKRQSLICGVSVLDGVIAPCTYESTLNSDFFVHYFMNKLLPALHGKHRIILMDNLPAHVKAVRQTLCRAAIAQGHLICFRPHTSPDFAPIEGCFSFCKSILRGHYYQLTNTNLPHAMVAAMKKLRIDTIANFFSSCHYFIQGKPYKPYQSPQ